MLHCFRSPFLHFQFQFFMLFPEWYHTKTMLIINLLGSCEYQIIIFLHGHHYYVYGVYITSHLAKNHILLKQNNVVFIFEVEDLFAFFIFVIIFSYSPLTFVVAVKKKSAAEIFLTSHYLLFIIRKIPSHIYVRLNFLLYSGNISHQISV